MPHKTQDGIFWLNMAQFTNKIAPMNNRIYRIFEYLRLLEDALFAILTMVPDWFWFWSTAQDKNFFLGLISRLTSLNIGFPLQHFVPKESLTLGISKVWWVSTQTWNKNKCLWRSILSASCRTDWKWFYYGSVALALSLESQGNSCNPRSKHDLFS